MTNRTLIILFIAGVLTVVYIAYQTQHAPPPAPPTTKPAPKKPDKPKKPCPGPFCPNPGQSPAVAGEDVKETKPELGGRVSPDGTVEIVLGDAEISWPKNIASKGHGCCGFRVLDYAARVQAVSELVNLPEKMKKDGVPGGAYPDKVTCILAQYAPSASYFQSTDKDWDLAEAMLKSKRLPCIDYNGHDPHYHIGIAHCVNLVALDRQADWAAILDNNYPSVDEIVWMSCDELNRRWGGWLYGLLAATPGDSVPNGTAHAKVYFIDAETAVKWEKIDGNADQYAAMQGKRQVGVWIKSKQEYWRVIDDGAWDKQPSAAPIEPPGAEHWPAVKQDGILNFGLLREERKVAELLILNGKAADRAAILNAIGPEMVPAKKPSPQGPSGLDTLLIPFIGIPLFLWIAAAILVVIALTKRQS